MTRRPLWTALFALGLSTAAAAAPPADRYVKWQEPFMSGNVQLRADCTPLPGDPPPGPDDRCVTLNAAPGSTVFAFNDIGRITLPGKAAKSLLCQWVTPFLLYSFGNDTGVFQPNARFRVTPSLTFENEVLAEPGLTDPGTGLPLTGSFEIGLSASHFESRSLDPGERYSQRLNYSRVCIGGILNPDLLAGYGMSASQIDRFFTKPITIRFNLSGDAALVTDASIFYGLRFVSD